MSKLKVGDPIPEDFELGGCGCYYYAEEKLLCQHDILKLYGQDLKLGDTVETCQGQHGKIVAIGTELGVVLITRLD